MTDSPAGNLRSRAPRSTADSATPGTHASRSSAGKLKETLAQSGDEKTSSTARDPSMDRVDRGRPRSGLEIPRKMLHSSISILVGILYVTHPNLNLVLRLCAGAFSIIATADLLRFRFPKFEIFYEDLLGYFMRESERHRVNGVIYYLGGVIISLTFYPRDIGCLSIIILSLCDTSASVFGRLFGRYTWPLPFSGTLFGAKKSMAGTIAAIVTGTIASYIFWSYVATIGDEGDLSWLPGRAASHWASPPTGKPTWLPRLPIPQSTLGVKRLSFFSGCVAGVAEAIDVWGLDDNLTLPVLFGFGCWLMMYILG